MGSSPTPIDILLRAIEQAYDHRSWHGTNLRGSLRGVTPAQAAWRPAPKRHNIWELVVHAAYWKYAATRRLTGEPKGSFPLDGSNWFDRTEGLTDRLWRADLLLLKQTHSRLHAAVASLESASLARPLPGSELTVEHLVSGIAAHDLYHAGQIQLLKRLAGTPKRR